MPVIEHGVRRSEPGTGSVMVVLVVVLLAAWLVLSIVGFAIEGILWLGLIGVVLFVATAIVGWLRRSTHRKV
ncbi:hypothetical protein [Jiangella alkaliphila]|nr:hypothetical protein [Jiangella alkaliphila]